MEKKLRISQNGEYVAVDVVDPSGVIKSTPLYVTPKSPAKVKAYDFEECRWWNAEVKLSGGKLSCLDETGLEWDVEPEDLIDAAQFHF